MAPSDFVNMLQSTIVGNGKEGRSSSRPVKRAQRNIEMREGEVPYRLTEGQSVEAIHRQFSDIPADLKSTFDYWESLRGDRLAPKWTEFDMMQLPHQALPTTHVVDWKPEQEDFVFRFFGSGYAAIHGVDLTGKSLMELPNKILADFIYSEYLSVVRGREKTLVSYGYRNEDDFVEIERCMRLPLSDDGVSISGLVAVGMVTGSIYDAEDFVGNIDGGALISEPAPSGNSR